MGIFRRKVPTHYVPVHPDNISKNDWIILLESGTIVGSSAAKLRVAIATLERKVVTKYNILLRPQHFLVLEDYDPRIHQLYFCPQLYALDSENKLVPLEGEEMGKLLAHAVQNGVVDRQPWYEPSENDTPTEKSGAPENGHYMDGHGCPALSLMRIAVQHGKPIVVHRVRTNALAEAAELPIGIIPL